MANCQTHHSDPKILSRRTLERDHRHLPPLLRPGMRVLDVGCGTGSITAGIAKLVGPAGFVTGLDRDEALLEIARRDHAGIPGLCFNAGDVLMLEGESEFDVATAARALQWIADPAEAVRRMALAVKPGGLVVALDYDHAENSWEPDAPPAFARFWRAFLDWRETNGWDNRMAASLPAVFESAGLREVESHRADEIAIRGEADFEPDAAIWHRVIESMGGQLVTAGFLSDSELESAGRDYGEWIESALWRQILAMATVIGRRV